MVALTYQHDDYQPHLDRFRQLQQQLPHDRRGKRRLQSALADVWRPKPPVSITHWIEEHFRLSPMVEASGGRYSLAANPFWREPLEMMQANHTRQISMKKSTQVGGTLTLIAAMLAFAVIDAAPAMVVTPDEISCIELRDRLYADAEESPGTASMAPPVRQRNTRHIDLGPCRTYLAWAGSAQRLRGRACKRVWRSEIDVFADKATKGGNPIAASSERVKRFFNSLIYDESSPSGDNSVIAGLYDLGDRRKWWCPCPQCHTWQVLRFFPFRDGPAAGRGGVGGLKDELGNDVPTDQAIRNAHYKCIAGCRVPAQRKDEMVRPGFWLPDGQHIRADQQTAKPTVSGTPKRSTRHVSYHLWSIHSPTVSLDSLVAAYLDRRTSSNLRKYFEDWLGLEFHTRRTIDSWETLAARLQWYHPRGTIPDTAWFLTAGVDVQQDGCFWVVRAWGDASTSWLVDFGYQQRFFGSELQPENDAEGVLRSDLKQLIDALIQRRFPVVDASLPPGRRDGCPPSVSPLGQKNMRAKLVGVDSNYYPRDVHQFVTWADDRRVVCIRGDHTLNPKQRFRENLIDRPKRGGPSYIGDGLLQWGIYTTAYKETLRDTKWNIPLAQPGSWMLPHGIARLGRDYMQQLVNERPIDEIGRDGRRRTIWKPRSEAIGNHYWDSEIYAFAMAEIVLHLQGLNWDASKWPVPKPVKPRRTHEQHIVRDDQ